MNIFENEKFVVANLKQSGSWEFFQNWIKEFKESWADTPDLPANLVICPPFPFLELFSRELKSTSKSEKNLLVKKQQNNRIFIGAQNVSSRENLENTGEVSVESISDFINFSIIGHSERKENFDEVKRKYEQCLKSKIVPIICFYENRAVYQLNNCLFAYEDPKSISKGGIYQEKDFNEMIALISDLKELFDGKSILYGGSVNEDNISMIKELDFFKGVLVGRSSLNPKSLISIYQKFAK
jgi:triosephosphate isomerase